MYILFTDETNLQAGENKKFLVYGGLFFNINSLLPLHLGIIEIRNKYALKPIDEFKFDTRSKPKNLSEDNFAKAKNEVINLCLINNCHFIAYLVHHKIAEGSGQDTSISFAVDHVIGRFQYFLGEKNDYGICLVDPLPIKTPPPSKFLKNKFTSGLSHDEKQVSLDRLLIFGTSSINASHVSSAMDIVLGAFRFCVNSNGNIKAFKNILPNVLKMMWGKENEKGKNIHDRGLILRPQKIIKEDYKRDYKNLLSKLGLK